MMSWLVQHGKVRRLLRASLDNLSHNLRLVHVHGGDVRLLILRGFLHTLIHKLFLIHNRRIEVQHLLRACLELYCSRMLRLAQYRRWETRHQLRSYVEHMVLLLVHEGRRLVRPDDLCHKLRLVLDRFVILLYRKLK